MFAFRDKTPTSARMNSNEILNYFALLFTTISISLQEPKLAKMKAGTIWPPSGLDMKSLLLQYNETKYETRVSKEHDWHGCLRNTHLQEKDTVKEYFLLWYTNKYYWIDTDVT